MVPCRELAVRTLAVPKWPLQNWQFRNRRESRSQSLGCITRSQPSRYSAVETTRQHFRPPRAPPHASARAGCSRGVRAVSLAPTPVPVLSRTRCLMASSRPIALHRQHGQHADAHSNAHRDGWLAEQRAYPGLLLSCRLLRWDGCRHWSLDRLVAWAAVIQAALFPHHPRKVDAADVVRYDRRACVFAHRNEPVGCSVRLKSNVKKPLELSTEQAERRTR